MSDIKTCMECTYLDKDKDRDFEKDWCEAYGTYWYKAVFYEDMCSPNKTRWRKRKSWIRRVLGL